MTSRYEPPTDEEIKTLRCHWVKEADPIEGVDPWVFIPGCIAAAMNPEGGCECDTLAFRLSVQIEQRRQVDRHVTELRSRVRSWFRAAVPAMIALTGRENFGGLHPQDLAREANRVIVQRSEVSA